MGSRIAVARTLYSDRLYPKMKIGLTTVTAVAAAIILASACTWSSTTSEDETDSAMDAKMADEKVEEAKEEEEKFVTEEERQFIQEKEEEKEENKDFLAMKKQLEEDEANMSDPVAGVSRLFFDEEMLALNERIHHLSQRVEEVSERVHSLAGLLEHIPLKVAKLESMASQREASRAEPFWGIQVGAYNTRSGAKEGWTEILANQAAIQLNDAKVQYFLSEPLKSGKRLTLIVINEYANHAAANSACNELKEVGVRCVAIRVTP